MGSALSSTGAAAGAEALFLRAQESATKDPERALAAYNLFQARLRQGPSRYPEALAALRQAVELEPDRYATHEEWKYPTQAILGAGGMGCAFLCREPVEGNRPVVVKTFWRAVPGEVQETFAEAMTMNRVGGGYVPALRGYGFAPGGRRPYIVMDYLDGYRDGEAWLAEHGPLPLAQGLALGRRVLEALAAAHAAGVVHLDLKPANLLLKAEGDGIAVKVIDFGLARVAERVDGARAAGASRQGLSVLATSIAGTWDYAPPEQMGQTQYGPPGPRSDLYAFGATWYRLLTGRPCRIIAASHLPKDCHEGLTDLILRLLEHDPKDRPASAKAVMEALEDIARLTQAPVGPESVGLGRPPLLAGPTRVQSLDAKHDLQPTVKSAVSVGVAPTPRTAPPSAAPVRTPSAPRPVAPVTPMAPEVPDIHGWSTAQVQALQKSAAEALGRPVVFRDRLQSGVEGPEMVIIPAGCFLMGSPEEEEWGLIAENERPQHLVTLSRPYALGRYAVTFDEYDAFCAATRRNRPEDHGWGRGRRPVIDLSWMDAVAYCAWLSKQTDQAYRLPSEAEWEYACRAGTTTPFWFGDNVTIEQVNYRGDAPYKGGKPARQRFLHGTVEVDALPANAWGLYQMHGNVAEWCADWFGDYPLDAVTDPGGPTKDFERVIRGGGWTQGGTDSRSARRQHFEPDFRHFSFGLRLAREFFPLGGRGHGPVAPSGATADGPATLAQPGAAPVGAAPSPRPAPPGAEPVRIAPAPRPVAPATRTAPEVPDIHGWSTAQVQALQQAAAEALGRPVVFRDPNCLVQTVETVKITGRRSWFGLGEPILKDQKVTKTITPPEMVVIPAGHFLMGSPDSEAGRGDDEGPQHSVTILRPFALGRYAVTFDDYDAFCVVSRREKPDDQGWGRGRRPVINVSWDDAVAYCTWLSVQTGQAYRLASEAEWEYACRAGTTTPFSTGACLNTDQANYDGNHPYSGCFKGEYRKRTIEVGSLGAPNPWGLHDMHGNVWEWVQDTYRRNYESARGDGSAWEGARFEDRVLRGGSWHYGGGHFLRSASRRRFRPGNRQNIAGFRLACRVLPRTP